MITAQCLKKNSSGCTHLSAVTTLTDRRKAAFPVRNECAFCYNTIYNSVPLELISLSQELLKLPLRSLRLSFTTESGPQTEQLLRAAGEILGPFLTDAGEAGEKAAVSGSGAIGHGDDGLDRTHGAVGADVLAIDAAIDTVHPNDDVLSEYEARGVVAYRPSIDI